MNFPACALAVLVSRLFVAVGVAIWCEHVGSKGAGLAQRLASQIEAFAGLSNNLHKVTMGATYQHQSPCVGFSRDLGLIHT